MLYILLFIVVIVCISVPEVPAYVCALFITFYRRFLKPARSAVPAPDLLSESMAAAKQERLRLAATAAAAAVTAGAAMPAEPTVEPSAPPAQPPAPAAEPVAAPQEAAAASEETLQLVSCRSIISGPITHEMIAKRAYFLWKERDRTPGGEHDDWQQAEEQLRRELARGEPSRGSCPMARAVVEKFA